MLSDPHLVISAIQETEINRSDVPAIIKAVAEIKGTKETLEILEKVTLKNDGITIRLSLKDFKFTLTKDIPMQMRRRGVEMRMVIESPDVPSNIDQALIKAVAKAHKWFSELSSGKVKSITEIAIREKVDKGYISHIINLAFLAPAVIEKIVAGKQPIHLTPERLIKKIEIPIGWTEQMEILTKH